MSKPIPPMMKYMTTTPHTIGDEQTLAKAASMMEEFGIRHLPVLRGGKLRGILTDRDIKSALSLVGVDTHKTTVADIATEDVFQCSPTSLLDEVAQEMAREKIGSAVILDNNKVVGIFTVTDALQALSDLLHSRLA